MKSGVFIFMAIEFEDDFEKLERDLDRACRRTVEATPRAAIFTARANVPVATSSLRESIYAITPGRSGYAAAKAKAESVNPGVEIDDEFPIAEMNDAQEHLYGGVIDAPAAHAGYVEYGSQSAHGGHTPATHFMEKVGDAHAGKFEETFEKELGKISQ